MSYMLNQTWKSTPNFSYSEESPHDIGVLYFMKNKNHFNLWTKICRENNYCMNEFFQIDLQNQIVYAKCYST